MILQISQIGLFIHLAILSGCAAFCISWVLHLRKQQHRIIVTLTHALELMKKINREVDSNHKIVCSRLTLLESRVDSLIENNNTMADYTREKDYGFWVGIEKIPKRIESEEALNLITLAESKQNKETKSND